jgi:hypothetical protein
MAVPRLQVLGGFQLFAGGEARAAPIAMKAQALLARPLWGDTEEQRARHHYKFQTRSGS